MLNFINLFFLATAGLFFLVTYLLELNPICSQVYTAPVEVDFSKKYGHSVSQIIKGKTFEMRPLVLNRI